MSCCVAVSCEENWILVGLRIAFIEGIMTVLIQDKEKKVNERTNRLQYTFRGMIISYGQKLSWNVSYICACEFTYKHIIHSESYSKLVNLVCCAKHTISSRFAVLNSCLVEGVIRLSVCKHCPIYKFLRHSSSACCIYMVGQHYVRDDVLPNTGVWQTTAYDWGE